MTPKKGTRDSSPLKTVLWLGAIGMNFAVCVVAGYYMGKLLQAWLGGELWLLAGLFLGIAAGAWSAVVVIKRFIGV